MVLNTYLYIQKSNWSLFKSNYYHSK